ncbi:hypothetical protein P8C59_008153 [Phyllachora maydis]|uniref:Uncharacterized protein n=1 Tax=Phyllachora maydis TaxID=1825666 RepID=A0AAD9IA19_9PEZI|nr:hypothetical protein P8C59_008153 [Phyllachora maydis]
MASFQSQPHSRPARTKTRGKIVKPLLKKLSPSEKNSLDLDRPWEEQLKSVFESNGGARGHAQQSSLRDAAGLAAGEGIGGLGEEGAAPPSFHGHLRSTSSSSFQHPFAQTPLRTATPPLTHANSVADFTERGSTITEAEDDDGAIHLAAPFSQPAPPPHQHCRNPSNLSQASLGRPSLASQRTSSFSDIAVSARPQLRVTTTSKTASATASRLGQGTANNSQCDLHFNLNLRDSPTGSLGGSFGPAATLLTSPTSSTAAPMSPLRSSFDAAGFPRLRSRSDMDTASRAEHIRKERRRFEERERAKEEKYDREMMRKRERRDTKEARSIEKEGAQRRKNSLGGITPPGNEGGAARPMLSRKNTPTNYSSSGPGMSTRSGGGSGSASTSRNDLSLGPSAGRGSGSRHLHGGVNAQDSDGEKQVGFMSRNYESVPPNQALPATGPGIDDVRPPPARPKRTTSAKKKTIGHWHVFLMVGQAYSDHLS